MIRAIIVENEPDSALLLKSYCQEAFLDVEILEICATVESSLKAVKEYLPDLLFLDVELNNNENGFDILKQLGEVNFEIIVTTAYDKYAVQACKASALDILVKPIHKDELVAAIEKYKKRKNLVLDPKQIELFLSIFRSSTLSLTKFALPTMTGLTFVETKNIIYFEGSDNQTFLYFANGNKICISMLLKECEKLLNHSNFCRIHKSYLINLNYIEDYLKGKDGTVVMSNSIKLTVSRGFIKEFLKRFGRL